jgi:hypothetical protein
MINFIEINLTQSLYLKLLKKLGVTVLELSDLPLVSLEKALHDLKKKIKKNVSANIL